MAELKGKQLLGSVIVALLAMGALSFQALPEAYCDLEDKTVKYVHMSESQKTVTKVFQVPGSDGEYGLADDRCQKGRTIGRWRKIDAEAVKSNPIQVISYVDNCATGEYTKWFCDSIGIDAKCMQDQAIEMPFG